MSARQPPAVALLVKAALAQGARVAAPADLHPALRLAGFAPSDAAPLDAAVLDRAGLEAPDGLNKAWRRVRGGGALVVQGPGVFGRLAGRTPDRPPALAPVGTKGGWWVWRVPALDALRPLEGVVTREIDRDLFLVDLRSGATFKLNAAGKAVWEGLLLGCTLEVCAAALPAAPPERALADVRGLVQDLAEAGLLVPA